MLSNFVQEVKKKGHTEVTTNQLLKGLKMYFGYKDITIRSYMKDLHKLGFIEESGTAKWRIT